MKKCIYVSIVVFFMYLPYLHSMQECKVETEEERQAIVNQAMIDFPHLVEYFDVLAHKYPHKSFYNFYDFLNFYLAKHDKDPCFGELICDVTDLMLTTIEHDLLAKVNQDDGDHAQDPLFLYIMKYKDTPEIAHVLKKCLEIPCCNKQTLPAKTIELGKELLFKNLLELGIDVNSTLYKPSLLSIACSYQQDRIVEHLLQAGADVNTDDFPLFTAVYKKFDILDLNKPLIVIEKSDRIVSLLLNAGADVNKPDDRGFYILPLSVRWRNNNVVRMILSVPGVNLNVQILQGRTALHRAVHYNLLDVVDMLLDTEIDTSVVDDEGRTAYDLAYCNDISMKLLFMQRRFMNSCCVIS